jgi:hypothetical protein
MIYTSENNWFKWQYGNNPVFGRQTGTEPFKVIFDKVSVVENVGSWKEELLKASRSIVDYYPNLQPNILFSGGVDSELVLRAFMDIGANPVAYIFRYEKDYNLPDVSLAIEACEALGAKYKVIDFNLTSFYENDAEGISEKAQIDRPGMLPQLKFLDYIDGLPIAGGGDMWTVRTHSNYTVKGKWVSLCFEDESSWSGYTRGLNRPAVMEFFKWSPGMWLAFMNLEWFKKLVDDGFYGKLGVNSTKLLGHREAYPDLIMRKKLTGFERADCLEMIREFEMYLGNKYGGFPYRTILKYGIEELKHELI